MTRAQPIILFDAKMYRHFAIVTIAITAAMAIFADGEKREAIAQQVSDIQERAENRREPPKLIIRDKSKNDVRGLNSFYSNTGGDLGRQINIVSNNTVTDRSRRSNYKTPIDPKMLAKLGLTPAQFRAMSSAEQQQVMLMLNNGVSLTEQQQAIQDSSVTSLQRSGGGAGADY